MTTDWQSVVNDPQVDIVAELAGGTTLARTMILAALKLGKPVVTANKALLSAHGEELFAAAQQYGTNLYYEASVCGGIPIIKALREGFVGNRITHLYGIVNGTCNYILTRMKLEGRGLRGGAQGRPGAGLRRGRAVARHRRLRCAAQDRHPGLAGARLLGEPQGHLRRRHPRDHADGHPVCRPTRLHDQAAGDHQAGRGASGEGQRKRANRRRAPASRCRSIRRWSRTRTCWPA